jgi:phosphate transport system permease protein
MASSAVVVLAITGAVGLFLTIRAAQALRIAGWSFITTQAWSPDTHRFGIAAAVPGTAVIALIAVVVATPISLGTALFISEIAPARAKRLFISVVDLMAAVPSVVYGLWGFLYLQGHVIGVARWISTWFGWVPIFKVPGADPTNPLANNTVYSASAFIAGIVVGLMIAPIQCSIMREVFSQAPAGEREGAFALGSTRWGMIRTVVLPFGKGGMIGGTMLALGRALGETVAVYLIISLVYHRSFFILKDGSITVSSLIATRYSDSSALGLSALFAAGLALFLLTLAVNFAASVVVARSRSGAQSEV